MKNFILYSLSAVVIFIIATYLICNVQYKELVMSHSPTHKLDDGHPFKDYYFTEWHLLQNGCIGYTDLSDQKAKIKCGNFTITKL